MRIIFACTLLFAATVAAASDLYVAPNGNDSQPGTADKPFATLQRARDAIRTLKAQGALAEGVTVNVADGRYFLAEPLTLEPQDSGTAQAPIVYQAAKGAHPVFSGGRMLSGWKKGDKGIWTMHIAEAASGQWYFEQLFVNGQRAVRARTPNKFFYYLQDVREKSTTPAAGKKRGEATQTFRMRPEDARAALTGLTPDQIRDVTFVAYHNWDNTRRYLDSIDAEHGVLVSSGEGMKPWNPIKRNSPYILENYLGALDSPGEWFLSRDGTLYYMPLPGEDMTRAEVMAPVTEKFVVIAGDPLGGRLVEHVALRGLSFLHGQYLTPRTGFEPMQAAAQIDAAVMIDGAKNVSIENCEIGHVGNFGIWFRKGCSDCSLQHCYVHDFGAGAIRIGEMHIPSKDAEQTGHIQLDNNIIRQGGRILPCAPGILIGQSGDNTVTHNEIADLFYSGISAGWTWGYHENLAKRNTFAFNHVHHLGQFLLSDMGGIYTLGPSEGTVVRNNVFHDINSYSYGGWGLYTDEGSTGVLFENNLVYHTKTGSFHQHYGQDNILRNNIFALNTQQQLQATRVEDHLSFTMEHNIVYWNTGKLLAGPWDKIQFVSHDNFFWQSAGQPIEFLGRPLSAWQAAGHEQNSQIVDPRFVDPAHLDFRLAADSPVVKAGFQPFDPSQAGVYGDGAWKAQARDVSYPELEAPPAVPPLELHETFEDDAIGAPPSGGMSHVEHKGDAIVVTDEAAAGGKRCVKIVDAPGLRNTFDPHLTFESLGHTAGRMLNTFDLRIAKDSRIRIEWRDYKDASYVTGPGFTIRDGKLLADKVHPLALPIDQWIHIEMECTLGPAASQGWTLRLTAPDQSPEEFKNLPVVSPDFRNLSWIGFSSDATYKTTFYLANVMLTRRDTAGK